MSGIDRMTRRHLLATLGGLAGAAVVPASGAEAAAEPAPVGSVIDLRLLETSDLHMFVMDWDYYRARIEPTVGLVRVASLIGAARAEVTNAVLLDNGDFLQGNPLADLIAEKPDFSRPHPLVEIMGSLGYDAATLGNHEFNFGLPFLEKSLAGAAFPFVCANVVRAGGAEFLPPHAILSRTCKDRLGREHTLRIGVVGFVPPQIMLWDKSRLEGKLEAFDIVDTAERMVPALRERCDVLVALCHSGIRIGERVKGQENAAYHLAGVKGFDAILTGHSHQVFPGKAYANLDGVDAVAGRLQGVPAVMPGFWGSHLGIVDLVLTADKGRWSVSGAKVEARPIYRREKDKIVELAPAAPVIAAAIQPSHEATLAWVERPAGTLAAPVHSYLVWTGFDPATAIVTEAQIEYARPLLAATPHAGLPILSSAAPYRAGYTPDSYIDLPAGPIAFRQVADLYTYSSNTVTGLVVSGAQVVEWLEVSARVFNVIDPAKTEPQPLLDKRIATYNFDVIAPLTYRIDVTKPARYDGQGRLQPDNRRILDVRYEGKPIDSAQRFVVLTNNYRADGGGNFTPLAGAEVALRAPDTNRDAVAAYFKARAVVEPAKAFPWTFAPTNGAKVFFDTAEAARSHAAAAGVEILGPGEPGYVRAVFSLPR